MKAMIRGVSVGGKHYDALMFVCPGCPGTGLHMLPVTPHPEGRPSWDWDGNLEAPTLSPSILTRYGSNGGVCHSFLRAGVFEFLSDCTHSLAGMSVPMPDLPDWVSGMPLEDGG